MTTELEQEFFKVFGIEPDCAYLFLIDGEGENKAARTLSFGSKADLKRFVCESGGKGKVIKTTDSPHIYYPEITDRILLEIVCILNKFTGYTSLLNDSIEDIREEILRNALFCHEQLKLNKADLTKQIQQLFKEQE